MPSNSPDIFPVNIENQHQHRRGLRSRSSSLFAFASPGKIDSPFKPSTPPTWGTENSRGHFPSISQQLDSVQAFSSSSQHQQAQQTQQRRPGGLRRLLRRASQPLRDVVRRQNEASNANSNGSGMATSTGEGGSSIVVGKGGMVVSSTSTGSGSGNNSGYGEATSWAGLRCCGFKLWERKLCKEASDEVVPGDGESGFFQDDEGWEVAANTAGENTLLASEPKTYPDFTQFLPTELSSHIFSYIDNRSLLTSCTLVSKRWHELAVAPYVWKQHFIERIGGWKGPRHAEWLRMYKAFHEVEREWREKTTTHTKYLKGHKDSVYCVQFDDDKIISGSRDRCIRVWDMKTLTCTRTIGYTAEGTPPEARQIGYHSASILCLQYDDEILVTGSSDRTCIIWDIKTFTPLKRLIKHTEGVLDVTFNKKYIVSCSKDTMICVWLRETGELLRTIRAHSGPVNAISMNGNFVASASGDGLVKLWDIESGEFIRDFRGHTRGLACVQFNDDMSLVVSGGNDHEIRVWDVASGECLRVLTGHTHLVRTLQVDSRNRRIISGSYDKTVAVWDLDTGARLIHMKQYHSTYVLTAKADFRRIISASQDKSLLVVDFGAKVKDIELLDHIFDR